VKVRNASTMGSQSFEALNFRPFFIDFIDFPGCQEYPYVAQLLRDRRSLASTLQPVDQRSRLDVFKSIPREFPPEFSRFSC
jgi:hypothetical protein